jgi:cellulose synthase operon protein C
MTGKNDGCTHRQNPVLFRVRQEPFVRTPSGQKFLVAFAVVMAFAVCPVHAAGDAGQATVKDAAKEGQNAKKIAQIRLLARAGKNEDAAAGMRALYPNGPSEGDPALEYYRIIGNTSRGWNEARTGLEKLVKAKPGDTRYRLALARHLTARPATRRAGIRTLAALAKTKQADAGEQPSVDRQPSVTKQPGVTKQQIMDDWRSALIALDHSPDNIGLYREYLAVDAGNAAVRDALAVTQRTEAERQPWLLRDKADVQLKQGHPEEAMATLKHALQLAPENPWVRFDLARLYHKRGFAKQGRALIDEGLAAAPTDPDMLYACALYLGLLDESDAALRLLDKIPAPERTPAMLRLRQKMAIQSQTHHAKVLAQNGRRADALAVLEHAGTDAGNDAELVNNVADAWLDIGETSRGVALLRRLLEQQSSPPIELRLRYAMLLNRAERDGELAPLLAQLDSSKKLSAKDREEVLYLQASLAARRADKLRHAGEYASASAALAPALKHDPENTDLLMALARVHIAAHQSEQARVIYQRILKRTPGDTGVRLALAREMGEMGDQAAAHREIETVLANTAADDFDTRLSVAEWYLDANDIAAARQIVDPLKKAAPDNPRVLLLSGRIAKAEGHYGEAMDDFKQANATDEISDLKRRRAGGYVTTGVDYLSKTDGTSGISNLTAVEIPIEMRVPVGYSGGQAFVQVDPVRAYAGTLSKSDSLQYGKVLALAPGGIASAPTQSSQGTALAVGYEGDGMRADIGTTPLGFPVSDVVGGVKWSRYTETSGFSLDVSRRPVTSSLLSYAGAHDPVASEVWGGVRTTGVSLHVSRDIGRLNVFFEPGYYWLTGRNVLSNTEFALRTGFDWSFIREEDMRLTAGLAFADWRYSENLRYYTFGHGGYYSPQKYYSLALPIRWTGREERWSYLLQGSVSASVSYEKDMQYYPTSVTLETAAGNPIYTGGNGNGTGWSLGGALEYKFTPQLFVGARLQIDRSAYYTPNFAILYLRYLFDAHTGPVPYPPEPVKAYSRY